MILLERAPFLAVLAGLAAMLALYERVAVWALPIVALLVALGVVASSFETAFSGQGRVSLTVAVAVCLFAAGVIYGLRPVTFPAQIETQGTVTEVRPWGKAYVATIKTPQGGFVLRLHRSELTEGMRVSVKGEARPFKGSRSGSDFREDRFWRARGMVAQIFSPKVSVLPEERWSIHRWRYGLYRTLSVYFPHLTGAYLNAAWTGKRDESLNAAHRAAGTSHLLAVSGFHVGIIMLAGSLYFRRGAFRVPLLSLLLWLYVLLTGAPSSAVRAALMIQVALSGELIGRPGSSLNSVSLAAVLLLLHSPFRFWDIGWRLSVLAALTISAFLERADPKDWRAWLFISPLVWLVTFPQVSHTFGPVPLAGVLTNLLAPAFFGFALSFASALAFLYLVGLPGTTLLLQALEGSFLLWGLIAEKVVSWVPWQLSWNFWLVYCSAGVFLTLVARSLFVPWRNVAILAPAFGLAAFALFFV